MSGHKHATISLSLEDYQQLLDNEAQQRASVHELPPPPPEVIQQTYQAIDENMAWMAERQDQFNQMFSQHDEEIRNVERAINTGLFEQQKQLMGELNEMAGSLWVYTDQLLQQVNQQYQNQIAYLQNEFFHEITTIEQQLVDRDAKEEGKLAVAEQWLSAATTLFHFIDQEYNHPFFLPGEIDRLGRTLVLAEKNLVAGLAEACIASTQQVYLGLENARARLEKEEMDWLILRQSAYEAVQMVYAEIYGYHEVHAIDLDGSPIDTMIDVDYWSKGQWYALLDDFMQVIEPLQQPGIPPTSQYLFDMVHQSLPDFRNRLVEVCFIARVEALNSQLRANIADIVVQALSVQGFTVKDYAYEQADWREAFQTHLSGMDQSSVTVQVIPSGADIGQNELHIFSEENPLTSQRELHKRWNEVEEMLVLSGLTVGDYQVVSRRNQPNSPALKAERARGRGH